MYIIYNILYYVYNIVYYVYIVFFRLPDWHSEFCVDFQCSKFSFVVLVELWMVVRCFVNDWQCIACLC